MSNDSIKEIREKEFKEIKKHQEEFFLKINKLFACLHCDINTQFKGYLILDLFELILYCNFASQNILLTKCDIQDRMKINLNSKYYLKAVTLLSTLYNVRNAYAHNSKSFNDNMMLLEELFRSIKSKNELVQIMRLIIPNHYPGNILNIFYLVERDNNNVYNSLYKSIYGDLYNSNMKIAERTINIILNRYIENYDIQIVQYCLLDILKNDYIILD